MRTIILKKLLVVALFTGAALIYSLSNQFAASAEEGYTPGEVTDNGDLNGDGKRNFTDVHYFVKWLFHGGPAPVVLDPGTDSTQTSVALTLVTAAEGTSDDLLFELLDNDETVYETLLTRDLYPHSAEVFEFSVPLEYCEFSGFRVTKIAGSPHFDLSKILLEVEGNVEVEQPHLEGIPIEISLPYRVRYSQFPLYMNRCLVGGHNDGLLTGSWKGTYAWNCDGRYSGETKSGAADIHFEIVDEGNGLLSGNASYLGGTMPIWGYRSRDPRSANTREFDPRGTEIRIYVEASDYFVGTEFRGTLRGSFISGFAITTFGFTPDCSERDIFRVTKQC